MVVLRRLRARRLARQYSVGLLGAGLAGLVLWAALSPRAGDDVDGGTTQRLRGAPHGFLRRLDDVEDPTMSKDQLRSGGVILHCIGLLYMFVAIAVVCDECFVPALEVITEVLNLSPDVAGATFMAAGGSAPEFFTSLFGAFQTSDIGTATIIGSAVFNVLFVIGACALVAKGPLELTWFPLARDSIFYTVALIMVTAFFLDGEVRWYEAVVLFLLYLGYCTFMHFNGRIEGWAKKQFKGATKPPVETTEEEGKQEKDFCEAQSWATRNSKNSEPPMEAAPSLQAPTDSTPKGSAPGSPMGCARSLARSNSHTSFVGQDKTRRKFRHTSQRVSLSVGNDHVFPLKGPNGVDLQPPNGSERQDSLHSEMVMRDMKTLSLPTPASGMPPELTLTNIVPCPETERHDEGLKRSEEEATSQRGNGSKESAAKNSAEDGEAITEAAAEEDAEEEEEEEEEEESMPLSLWPPGPDSSTQAMIMYVVTWPIVLLLVITVPDVRRPGWRKYFVITFLVSIMWVAFFTWAMVWFVRIIADTCGIGDKSHIMGLTILAAGTSVPDLLTSMIVAREGHGDMAISSSIGSNIFDVTVGLPIPWLLYSIAYGKAVEIQNEGLEVNVLLLLGMLAVTIGCVMRHDWVMTKWMGLSMLVLYGIFIVTSVILTTLPAGSLNIIAN